MQRTDSQVSTRTLIGQLSSDVSDYTRGCAALSLGQAKERRALDPLLTALSDESPWVRGWAAFALGELQEPRTLTALCNLLGDDDHWVRQQAADAVVRFDGKLTNSVLRNALKGNNPLAKAWTLHVIAQKGDPDSALDVIPILEDGSRAVRLSAVRTLYRLGQATAVAPVRMFMRDPDEHLRGAAAFALGALGDYESTSALCLALTDPTPWVRRNAAWSLLELGESLRLVASMTEDPDAGVRCFANNARDRLVEAERNGVSPGDDGSSP